MTDFAHPYGAAAEAYWKKAWLPFPVKGKNEAIPRGVTGREGKDPGWAEIQDWKGKRPFSNVAVRANGWVAIDVDAGGEVALEAAIRGLGDLPATWTSTARGRGSERRHLFYRVPVGFSVRLAEGRFVKKFGAGVDIIHRGHRYAVVSPSKHPDTGQAYTWYGPDGEVSKVPVRTELPMLPDGWMAFLAEQPAGGAGAAGGEEDFWDGPGQSGYTERGAYAEIERMCERIRSVDSNINTQAGGAMRQIGRFVPAILSENEAVAMCRDALLANPVHSDEWNLANGKDWNALTLAATSVANGMTEPHPIVAEEDIRTSVPDSGADVPDVSKLYTEAAMAERLASEVIPGRFCYVPGLDWLSWDGTRWVARTADSDVPVVEAVRQWAIAGYEAAVRAYFEARRNGADHEMKDDPHVSGWFAMQALARMKRVVELARGVAGVARAAREFDADPWLLNTPGGVVDLRTREVTPHHPDQRHTKITAVRYVKGAESEAVKRALEAVPDDAHVWLQLRLGEAITGHSGDQMVLLTGGGRNGKTVLMGSAWRAMGDYARKVPNTLLLKGKNPGGPTPEKMTLRGVRLAYMEETPEESYLDSQVVKDLLDAEVIEGRHLYKNIVDWVPTHSLFLNTNHPPRVTDTGDGTWRRLTRLDFPFRYRKAGEAFERETDRAGDPGLKPAMRTQEAQEALLAWMVEGAVAIYRAGSLEQAGEAPESVLAGAARWREESDPVLRFLVDRMSFEDRNAWVAHSDLYELFTTWMDGAGLRRMSSAEFSRRIEVHSGLPKPVTFIQRRPEVAGLSRPAGHEDWLGKTLESKTRGWLGMSFKITP